MLSTGATAFRLNTSHLELEQLWAWLDRLVPFLDARQPRPVLVLDLQGSKWRLGQFAPLELVEGQSIQLVLAASCDQPDRLPVPHIAQRFNDRIVTTSLASETALQLPLERASLFLRAGFDWSESDSVQAQLLYADYETRIELGPPESGLVLASPANPYVPPDLAELLASRGNPGVPFRLLKRLEDLPNRVATNDRELLQLTVSADGDLAGEWRYGAYLQWGRNDRRESRTGNALTGEIQALVNSPDGGLAACGIFNLFGNRPIDPACARRVTAEATNSMRVEQRVFEAVADGPLMRLPAGPLRAALGGYARLGWSGTW